MHERRGTGCRAVLRGGGITAACHGTNPCSDAGGRRADVTAGRPRSPRPKASRARADQPTTLRFAHSSGGIPRMRSKVFALVWCTVAVGCGNTSSSGQADALPPVPTASEYCESIAPFFCEFYVRCGRMAVDSKEACLPVFLESCNAKYEGGYVGLEAAGLLSLSVTGLAACEAHLQTVACEEQFFELAGPCKGIWEGHQGTGAACGFDTESFVCDGSSECVLGLDLCGTCRALVAVGDMCTPGEDTCGADASCIEGLCVARKKNGESCTGPNDKCYPGSGCIDGLCAGPSVVGLGDTCDQTHRCPYLSACIGGSCQPAVLLGAACSATTPCATGYCDGVCTAPAQNGGSCANSSQCWSGLCVDGVCRARPSGCIQ